MKIYNYYYPYQLGWGGFKKPIPLSIPIPTGHIYKLQDGENVHVGSNRLSN